MTRKQASTKGMANPTVKRTVKGRTVSFKTCPKCGKQTLRRGQSAQSGKRRWSCVAPSGDREYCYSTTDPNKPYSGRNFEKEAEKNPQFRRKLGGVKRFVVTAAQNATPVHEPFFESLLKYCEHNDAELVVIPLRYKNPTSRWTMSQVNAESWADEVGPYLYNQRKKLNENLVLLADIKTQPTAVNPLQGFESLTHGESGILGHTKLQLETVATPSHRYPKVMTTTGACTIPNYSDTKAGKKGEFHHALAAVAVDIIGKKFSIRQLNATKDGSFVDFDQLYTPKSVSKAPRPLALVFGDTHRACMDKQVEKVTFGPGGIVDQLDPEHLVFHDLHDGISTNHHVRKDPFAQVAKRVDLLHLVKEEVMEDVMWLARVCAGRSGVLVASNHDDFLARWLREQDWRGDPENAEFYLETALHLVKEIKSGNAVPHPFTYWVDRLKGKAPIRCLKRDESFALNGVELSLHGDKGPNGSRGSRKNLRRIGVKSIIGHSHSPGIEEGCYQTGTSTPLRLDYNEGPSSWMHCHCVLYANGKRSLLFIIDGEWRL